MGNDVLMDSMKTLKHFETSKIEINEKALTNEEINED